MLSSVGTKIDLFAKGIGYVFEIEKGKLKYKEERGPAAGTRIHRDRTFITGHTARRHRDGIHNPGAS